MAGFTPDQLAQMQPYAGGKPLDYDAIMYALYNANNQQWVGSYLGETGWTGGQSQNPDPAGFAAWRDSQGSAALDYALQNNPLSPSNNWLSNVLPDRQKAANTNAPLGGFLDAVKGALPGTLAVLGGGFGAGALMGGAGALGDLAGITAGEATLGGGGTGAGMLPAGYDALGLGAGIPEALPAALPAESALPLDPGPIEGLPPVGDAPVVPPVVPVEPIPRVTVTPEPLPIGAPVTPEAPLPEPTLPPPILPIPPLPTETPPNPDIDPGTGLPKIPTVLPKLPGDKTSPVGDAVDLIGKFGPSVLGIGTLLANQKKSKAYADQLASLGGPQRETATRQLADANAGKINAADQWRIDQYKQDSTTRAQQFYSKAGIPDSTQLVGTLNDVGARSAAMFEETRQAMMKSAMTELDTLDNGTRAAIKMEMEADAAAQKAIIEFMSSMAKLFTGSNAKSLTDAAGGVADWLKTITDTTGTDTTGTDTTGIWTVPQVDDTLFPSET